VATLGFPGQTTRQLQSTINAFPVVTVAGLASLGREGVDVSNDDVHYVFAGVNKQQASHNLKIGLDVTQRRINIASLSGATGTFGFGATYTNGPLDNSATSPAGVGQGLAALLLGQPASGSLSLVASQAIRATQYAFMCTTTGGQPGD
jgi:hypothetical protein